MVKHLGNMLRPERWRAARGTRSAKGTGDTPRAKNTRDAPRAKSAEEARIAVGAWSATSSELGPSREPPHSSELPSVAACM